MKQFISTKFFCALQEASQTGLDIDVKVLENKYNEFIMLLFSEQAVFNSKTAYHHTLVHTRVELSTLTQVSGKKCGHFL